MQEAGVIFFIVLLVIGASYLIRWFLGIGKLIEEQERTNRYLSSMSSTMNNIERLLKKSNESCEFQWDMEDKNEC